MQHLIKTIVTSRTYQLGVTPNKWNEDDKINFSHAIPRRLTAEQMIDAVAIATGTKPKVQGLPDEMRSVYLADGLMEGNDFLKLFGRPKRESACECERTSNVSLAHALNLINGPLISGTVIDPNNDIAKLVEERAGQPQGGRRDLLRDPQPPADRRGGRGDRPRHRTRSSGWKSRRTWRGRC